MKAYSALFFMMCLNIAAVVLSEFQIVPAYSRTFGITPSDISSYFNINVFSALTIAIGGGVIGLIGILTKQNIYAIGIILIWVMGVMFKPISWILQGLPIVLDNLLNVGGVDLSIFKYGIIALYDLIFFIFLAEIISQRQIT